MSMGRGGFITTALWLCLGAGAFAQSTAQTGTSIDGAAIAATGSTAQKAPDAEAPDAEAPAAEAPDATDSDAADSDANAVTSDAEAANADAEGTDAEAPKTPQKLGPVDGATILRANFSGPVERYGHQVLGNTPEYSQLDIHLSNGTSQRITLPENRIFEDITPRIVDLDQDGQSEVMVIESDMNEGARLALFNSQGLVAATPFIGQRNRWLAPVGVADFDGDGQLEIAYIETPHLTGTVRIVEPDGKWLKQLAAARGLTNHRIGDASIFGGIRDCGHGPEMILAQFPWGNGNKTPMVALEVSQPDMKFIARPFPAAATKEAMHAAMNCTLSPNY